MKGGPKLSLTPFLHRALQFFMVTGAYYESGLQCTYYFRHNTTYILIK